jgi:hypothetical protein
MGQAASLQRRAPAAARVGNETDQLTQWLVVRQSLALTDKKMLSSLQHEIATAPKARLNTAKTRCMQWDR